MPTLAGLARTAFAHGWALSGGPLTDRVRAGAAIATEMALADPGRPGVLEAVSDLGFWEGIAATLNARRDELEDGNLAALRPRWLALTGQLDRDRLTRGLLRRLTHGITEAAARPPLNAGADADALAAMVQAALENAANSDPGDYQATRSAFRDAIVRAQAEGRVSAIAAGARKLDAHGTRVDLEGAYADAEGQLLHVAGLWTEADTWLHNLMGYSARDIGREISRLEQPDEAGVAEVLERYLDDPEARALATAVDQLTGRAVIQGVLDLYAQAGITTLDMVALPGACPRCLDAASNSPYRVGRQPPVPVHPHCRCDVHPHDQVLPESVITPYLLPRES